MFWTSQQTTLNNLKSWSPGAYYSQQPNKFMPGSLPALCWKMFCPGIAALTKGNECICEVNDPTKHMQVLYFQDDYSHPA